MGLKDIKIGLKIKLTDSRASRPCISSVTRSAYALITSRCIDTFRVESTQVKIVHFMTLINVFTMTCCI